MKKIRKRKAKNTTPPVDCVEFKDAVMYMFGHSLAFWNLDGLGWTVPITYNPDDKHYPHFALVTYGLAIRALKRGEQWLCSMAWDEPAPCGKHWAMAMEREPRFEATAVSDRFAPLLLGTCEALLAEITRGDMGECCKVSDALGDAIAGVYSREDTKTAERFGIEH